MSELTPTTPSHSVFCLFICWDFIFQFVLFPDIKFSAFLNSVHTDNTLPNICSSHIHPLLFSFGRYSALNCCFHFWLNAELHFPRLSFFALCAKLNLKSDLISDELLQPGTNDHVSSLNEKKDFMCISYPLSRPSCDKELYTNLISGKRTRQQLFFWQGASSRTQRSPNLWTFHHRRCIVTQPVIKSALKTVRSSVWSLSLSLVVVPLTIISGCYIFTERCNA